MLSSIVTRKLFRQVAQSGKNISIRQFSLLVPLQQKTELPQEVESYPLTEKEFGDLQTSFKDYNEGAHQELKEMNQNRISNIIERGGADNWTTASDLSSLTRSFEFSSFEQGQQFVQEVGKFCSKLDHHPEWNLTNDGKTINIKLTSHFAGNQVTLHDFQLAEHMNQSYKITIKSFRMFPIISSKAWSSFLIFLGMYFGTVLLVQFFHNLGHPYPSAGQRGQKPQSAHYRPQMMVAPFAFQSGNLRNNQDVELYTKSHADDYAFKSIIFSQKKGF